jgi:hypothetical protein
MTTIQVLKFTTKNLPGVKDVWTEKRTNGVIEIFIQLNDPTKLVTTAADLNNTWKVKETLEPEDGELSDSDSDDSDDDDDDDDDDDEPLLTLTEMTAIIRANNRQD